MRKELLAVLGLLVCPLGDAQAKPPDCHWCVPLDAVELELDPGQSEERSREVEPGRKYYGYLLAEPPATLDIHAETAEISAPACVPAAAGAEVFCTFVAETAGEVHFRVMAGEESTQATLEMGWDEGGE
jgi:hypothetical protein